MTADELACKTIHSHIPRKRVSEGKRETAGAAHTVRSCSKLGF